MYVWGYGILGKGPNVQQAVNLQLLPKPLFGYTTFSKDVQVEKVFSGMGYLAALTSK